MQESFDKAKANWLAKHKDQLDRLQAQSNVVPPITGSLDDVLRAAEEAAHAQQELTEQERLTAVLDTFSVRYAEYATAFSDYRSTSDEAKKTILTMKYQAFQDAMNVVKENPPVVAFLRETDFAQYFPKESTEQQGEHAPIVDKETKARFHLQQRLINDFIAAQVAGQDIPIEHLAATYYPGVERQVAHNRLHTVLPKVRRALKEKGYQITNLTPIGEGSKRKTAVYHVEKVSQAPNEAGEKTKRDEPVRESRLAALTYIVSTENPDIQEVISILGKTKVGKHKAHDLTPWNALVALDRNVKKLYRRVDEGVATENEQRMHVLMEQFFQANECTISDFRTYIKDLFGFAPAKMEGLTTPESKVAYLDKPVVDDVPFTRRDAVYLATTLNYYQDTIRFFCNDCTLPDKETIDSLFKKLGDVLEEMEGEHSEKKFPDANVIVNRLEAIQHYVVWRNRNDFFETFERVSEFEFFQVIYNLHMLEAAQISINGELYGGLQFLAALFNDPRTRRFIALEVESQKQQSVAALSTQEMESVGSQVIEITVPEQEIDTPLEVPDIGEVLIQPTVVFQAEQGLVGQAEQKEVRPSKRKDAKQQQMQKEISAIVEEVGQIPDLEEFASTATITRHFPALTQTVFDREVKRKHITPTGSTKRHGIPLYDKQSVAMLLYLESKRDEGGVHPSDVKTARKIIDKILNRSGL